jgi:hypothetical protein
MKSLMIPNPSAEFSVKVYGEEIKITTPNSDLDINEVLDILKRLVLASGFSESTWKNAVVQLAMEYEDSENTD